jgi:hypothetical protein
MNIQGHMRIVDLYIAVVKLSEAYVTVLPGRWTFINTSRRRAPASSDDVVDAFSY